jgi:hypothetical protein
LKEQPEYKNRSSIEKALQNTFLGLDYMLLTPGGLDEMIKISKEAPPTEFTIERILR